MTKVGFCLSFHFSDVMVLFRVLCSNIKTQKRFEVFVGRKQDRNERGPRTGPAGGSKDTTLV